MKDDFDIYETFRDYIKHEDQLINYRMTWMLTIHGFLYATFGFTIQKLLEVIEKGANEVASKICISGFVEIYTHDTSLSDIIFETKLFLLFVCAIGAVISGSAFYSLQAAYLATTAARTIFGQFKKSASFELTRHGWPGYRCYIIKHEGDTLRLPLLTGGGRPTGAFAGFWASCSIPGVLLLSWIISIYCVINYVHFNNYQIKGIDKWCPAIQNSTPVKN